jgi:hypothetical protein
MIQFFTDNIERMTSPSDRMDPTVPIGSGIIKALKVAPQSASALARRLKLRKADVLVACRALAAAGQIHRLGNRWALRPPVRCAGSNEAGRRCARMAAYGSAFCTHHEPDAVALPPRLEPLAPQRSIAENTPFMNAKAVVASPVPPRELEPARPPASDAEPELFVRSRRVTEADVIEALSMLGDEQVQAYYEGRLPKAEAYRIAHHRLRTLARMTADPW